MTAYHVLILALVMLVVGGWFEACVLHAQPKPRPAKYRRRTRA